MAWGRPASAASSTWPAARPRRPAARRRTWWRNSRPDPRLPTKKGMGYTLPMNPGLRQERVVDTHTKALHINLDQRRYGTFAEIGAGQEVVRWFFRVGGAAGTIAK